METKHAAAIFEVLASDIRLDIFRLLAQNAPNGLVAGDISRALGIPASNLSFHLKALMNADLAAMEKEGRFLRYRANIPLMLETSAFLARECGQTPPEAGHGLHAEDDSISNARPKRRVW